MTGFLHWIIVLKPRERVRSTLFLLYINVLVDGFAKSDSSIKLYADDAKLYSSF